MDPAALTTARLVLDQPTLADADLIAEYCQDPVFEHFMTTPWPYTRPDAVGFIEEYVPGGWATGREYTWAIRTEGRFLGVIGYRIAGRDIGFWLGEPHRGNGYMPEATATVVDWLFGLGTPGVRWECVVGNLSSLAVARKAGFRFTGEREATVRDRDGGHPLAWHGELSPDDSREPKPGWPA
ncbi:MAG: hypothetical protein QOF79_3073 [Actinomycetota bacterium]|jgi:RimJ/RimL family protein N-acetyltransferase|nr:hypothetical protein [Actinomycetota bacterium]